MSLSISVCKGKGSLNHNNRIFFTENVDRERTKNNIIYKSEKLEEAYKKCFEKAIEEYNLKQKRKDKKINGVKGYMEKIRSSKNGEKLFYENIVQVGNMFDSQVGTESGKLCEKILDRYMKDFQVRNPNLYVFNAVMHLDEQTPHLHIDYIPLAHGYKNGLQCRNSLDKAYKEQGIDGKANKYANRTITWQNSEKKHIESIMLELGIEKTEEKGFKRKHLSVEQYKAVAENAKNEILEIQRKINKKPSFFTRKNVTVNRQELLKLQKRAILNKTHEESTKKLLTEIQKDKEDFLQYKKDASERIFIREQDSLSEYKKAEENRKKIEKEAIEKASKITEEVDKCREEQKKYESLYAKQKTLNEDFEILKNKYSEKFEENTKLKTEISNLYDEKYKLINRISELEKENLSLNDRLLQLKEYYEKNLKKTKEMFANFQNMCMNACRRILNHLDLSSVNAMILQATVKATSQFLFKQGFEELSKDSGVKIKSEIGKYFTSNLYFTNGEKGIGLYTEKDEYLGRIKDIKAAKELFPCCNIKDLTIKSYDDYEIEM